MIVLVDYNMVGQALLLWGTFAAEGWLELLPLRLATFKDVALPADSADRAVWRFCQERDMILLTGNRSMKGEDSLEQVLREENHNSAWPVVYRWQRQPHGGGRVPRGARRAFAGNCVGHQPIPGRGPSLHSVTSDAH